jgi:hypothetical protein
VIYEAALRGHEGIGTEVNPAAWVLASLASLSHSDALARANALVQFKDVITNITGENLSLELIYSHYPAVEKDPIIKKCMAAAMLLGMKNGSYLGAAELRRGGLAIEKLVDEISQYKGTGSCLLEDARKTTLKDGSVDGVITSPPYINVFNYHQNYRPAIELLGWKPLEAAKSEIGANRKHRQNRFLTVIQYCLDMAMVVNELARVCKVGASVVMVVGRESNVLGSSFLNSQLIKNIFMSGRAFVVRDEAERVFTNRYGQHIYEDLLLLECVSNHVMPLDSARDIGAHAIEAAITKSTAANLDLLLNARNSVGKIKPSPFLDLSFPY